MPIAHKNEVETYEIGKGYCVIFDNYQFIDINLNRDGSPQDRKNLKEAFKEILHYEVEEKVNLTAKEIISHLISIRRKINAKILKPNPFVAIFLSHGHKTSIYGIDENCVEIRKILNLFSNHNCEPLKDILKLIIIGSCRGGIYLPFLEFF